MVRDASAMLVATTHLSMTHTQAYIHTRIGLRADAERTTAVSPLETRTGAWCAQVAKEAGPHGLGSHKQRGGLGGVHLYAWQRIQYNTWVRETCAQAALSGLVHN